MGVNGTSGILQVLRYVGVPYGVEPNCRCREEKRPVVNSMKLRGMDSTLPHFKD